LEVTSEPIQKEFQLNLGLTQTAGPAKTLAQLQTAKAQFRTWPLEPKGYLKKLESLS